MLSKIECWSGPPCPPPGNLSNLGIEHESHVSCIGRWVLYNYTTWEAEAALKNK